MQKQDDDDVLRRVATLEEEIALMKCRITELEGWRKKANSHGRASENGEAGTEYSKTEDLEAIIERIVAKRLEKIIESSSIGQKLLFGTQSELSSLFLSSRAAMPLNKPVPSASIVAALTKPMTTSTLTSTLTTTAGDRPPLAPLAVPTHQQQQQQQLLNYKVDSTPTPSDSTLNLIRIPVYYGPDMSSNRALLADVMAFLKRSLGNKFHFYLYDQQQSGDPSSETPITSDSIRDTDIYTKKLNKGQESRPVLANKAKIWITLCPTMKIDDHVDQEKMSELIPDDKHLRDVIVIALRPIAAGSDNKDSINKLQEVAKSKKLSNKVVELSYASTRGKVHADSQRNKDMLLNTLVDTINTVNSRRSSRTVFVVNKSTDAPDNKSRSIFKGLRSW